MNTQYKKVLQISAVVFLHVAVITLMLGQHGCKSDGAKAGAPEPTTPMPAAAPAPAAMPAPVATDNNFVAPMRPAPVTPVAPIPVAQYSEPLTTEPIPAAPSPTAPTVTWVVASGDKLTTIARKNNITVDELVAANAPKVTRTSTLKIGQTLIIPSGGASAQPAAAASANTPMEGSVYTVVSGDSLNKIAAKNSTTVKALKELNKLTSDTVRIGQKLKLPDASGSPAAPASSSTASASATVDTSSGEYTVVAGDTLSKIAVKTGTKVKDLMSANNLTDATARSLHPGQKLQLPSGAHAADTSMPATPTTVTATPSLFSPTQPAPLDVTGVPATTTNAPITPVQ